MIGYAVSVFIAWKVWLVGAYNGFDFCKWIVLRVLWLLGAKFAIV